jgi:hypothetical protein
MWFCGPVLKPFSTNVVLFSTNPVASILLFSTNVVRKVALLSTRPVYVLSSLHLLVLFVPVALQLFPTNRVETDQAATKAYKAAVRDYEEGKYAEGNDPDRSNRRVQESDR